MKNKLAWAALALAVVTGASGLAAAQDGRYYDRDDNRYYDRDDNRYNDRDGYRYDSYRRGRKPFNPNPRGRYDDADHGYRRQFGNKHEYREHYSEAYRDGYMSTFRGRGYYR